jgi:pseudaminic acid synthase
MSALASQSVPAFEIAGRKIGPQYPPYVIAEISCNFAYANDSKWGKAGKDYQRCVELIKQAAAAGCDAVKLQTYRADTITMKSTKPHFMIKGAKVDLWNEESLHSLYEKNSMPWEWTEPLMKVAKEYGLALFTSPFDETAVDYLENLNVPAYKIASFESTDHGLLRKVASTGKPIIMSTGMATIKDIDESISVLRAAGVKQLAVLKCTSSYPAQPKDANVSGIRVLRDTWNIVPGLSDHTLGNEVAMAAVAMGACIIEKHIIIDRECPTADAPFSMTGPEFQNLVQSARIVREAIGNPHIAFGKTTAEGLSKKWRRSIFVVKDVKKGDKFVKGENVRSIRPAAGLHTRHWDLVLGSAATCDLEAGTPLDFHHLTPSTE